MGEEIVTTSFVKRMVEEIEDLKKINQQHRTINGELREEKDNLKKRVEEAIEILENNDHEHQGAINDALNVLKGEER